MIEKIIWYLVALDCFIYAGLTVSARYHNKKAHHFWKGIPLHWALAVYYTVLVAWSGYALSRIGVLF
ncbi:MAG: hypothetical protein QF475_01790 [Candidatus Undinarchaeales archaeon]|jgi:hypothetical protein|nr:hypothetical protein [Candidatus Undinarchaeales archaeon]